MRGKPSRDPLAAPATYAERLAFVVWYAVLKTGIDGATKLSEAIGKRANTLSKWAAEQPSFDLSALVADAVGVNALWLHDPARPGAEEPELFREWLRNTRQATQARQTEAPRTARRRA